MRKGEEGQDELSLGTPADERDILKVQDEEVITKKSPISPTAPSQAEIGQHRIAHLPYRSLCADCVEAFKGPSSQRR